MFEVMAYIVRRHGVDAGPEGDPGDLRDELLSVGYAEEDVERALYWLRKLRSGRALEHAWMEGASAAVRATAPAEFLKLSPEARGFLLRLERGGLLSWALREAVYEASLTLDVPELGVEEVCVLLALLLKASSPRNDTLAARILEGEIRLIVH